MPRPNLPYAKRSPYKDVRVGTHRPVLKTCLRLDPNINCALEHGMGLSSTPFFHEQKGIKRILSFEDDSNWMKCGVCPEEDGFLHDDVAEHVIATFEGERRGLIGSFLSPTTTIALVDGPHLQRIKMLRILQELRVPYIIEHDSESLPPDELLLREEIARSSGYNLVHYTAQNPESILYSIPSVTL